MNLVPADLSLKQKRTLYRWIGSILVLASLCVTAYVVIVDGPKTSLTTFVRLLLMAISACLQFAAAFIFSLDGKIAPALVHTAVDQLEVLIQQIKRARVRAENALLVSTSPPDRLTIGMLSVELSTIEDQTTNAVNIWRESHPDAQIEFQEIDQ